MPILLKRIYEPPTAGDGCRILTERLWPRGLARDKARVDLWLKEAAPSTELRRWFGHDPEKWPAFCDRYFARLREHEDLLAPLRVRARSETLTFVFASRETRFNNSVALKAFLEAGPGPGTPGD